MLPDRPIAILSFLVLLLPLAGFIVLAMFGDWIRKEKDDLGAGILACATVVAAFGLTVVIGVRFAGLEAGLVQENRQNRELVERYTTNSEQVEGALQGMGTSLWLQPYFPSSSQVSPSIDWIRVGAVRVPLALLIDRLALVMMLVVTGVGALIHIYSLGYMAHDPERIRYFSYLNLFTFFMLLLVTAGSLPLMFVGWEGVGLCSYLLIGFWYKKQSASDAGKKAFIVNRIGDAGLILGTIVAFYMLGTFDLRELADAAGAAAPEAWGVWGPLTAVSLLLFVGACGKSAQVPLHVWLPDAMEGPTPVSALIHAATMVTAGVYLVARLSPLFVKSAIAMTTVATVGTTTAVLGATVALVQTDIKKVLAYSTVSQLGYMFLACGVGAFGVGVFHLYTHAFFKALLFLGAGSVIHALGGEQDLRQMGGLRSKIPWTFWTFVAASCSIAGLPLFAGFFSKDAILAGTWAAHRPVLFALGVGAAALTAFYMARLVFLAFFRTYRGPEETRAHIHESPAVMVVPLVLLAVGAIAAGYIDVPHLLARVTASAPHAGHPEWLPLLASLMAVGGIVVGVYLYLIFPATPGRLARRLRPLQRLLEAKYFFDHAYNWIVARVVVGGSTGVLWRWVDARIIDGAVNGVAAVVNRAANRLRPVQSGLVRGYALVLFGGAVALLVYLVWS
jgi:NADH-quinone oxidoreductase subunit L